MRGRPSARLRRSRRGNLLVLHWRSAKLTRCESRVPMQAWGRRLLTGAFCDWMKEHHFDRMPKSVRSVAIELHENIHAIEQWRTTLTEKQRRRLQGPLQNVRRWKREIGQVQSKRCDAVAKAEAAWRRFVSCVNYCRQIRPCPCGVMCRRKRRSIYNRLLGTAFLLVNALTRPFKPPKAAKARS